MATQKDIAREAGVSNSLVSYYLTGSKSARMSDETRKRIDAAIRKLNYRPNQLARSLRTGRSKSIGMLIGNISDSYFGHLAEEVLDAARKHDYSLILAMTKNELQERANALEFLMRNQIDGLLTCLSVSILPGAKELQKRGIPVLRFGYPEPHAISLLDDVETALEEACLYFRGRGHRRVFCFFDTPLPWNTQLDNIEKKVGIKLIHRTFGTTEETEELLHCIETDRPEAILMNGRILYPLLERIDALPHYDPEIVAGVDEFRLRCESRLIVGGIQTNTTLKAQQGIEMLINCLDHPELSREGSLMLPPAKFIRYRD